MENSIKPVLVTGAAGFIGAAVALKILNKGEHVIGIDNLNNYYDPNLKKDRISYIEKNLNSSSGRWTFYQGSIEDINFLKEIFNKESPRIVVNLAAQAGVRYSLENPYAYIQSNLLGFFNIIECSRLSRVEHFIYASSSSVYGGNKNLPFVENQSVDHPVSLYAATKKSNELIAHTYSHLFNMPTTGLRFFTVYGPWGRPDMAPMIFAKSILTGTPIKVFNFGKMRRDFTYIDDVAESVLRCCYKPATPSKEFDDLSPNPAISNSPYRIFNIGNSNPVELLNFIEILENALGKKAIKDLQPIQPGDVVNTAANTKTLQDWISFKPIISIEKGVDKFVNWFLDYYQF